MNTLQYIQFGLKSNHFTYIQKQWDMLDNRMAQYVIAQRCQVVIYQSNSPVVQTAVFQVGLV